jgi:hypothetical protein
MYKKSSSKSDPVQKMINACIREFQSGDKIPTRQGPRVYRIPEGMDPELHYNIAMDYMDSTEYLIRNYQGLSSIQNPSMIPYGFDPDNPVPPFKPYNPTPPVDTPLLDAAVEPPFSGKRPTSFADSDEVSWNSKDPLMDGPFIKPKSTIFKDKRRKTSDDIDSSSINDPVKPETGIVQLSLTDLDRLDSFTTPITKTGDLVLQDQQPKVPRNRPTVQERKSWLEKQSQLEAQLAQIREEKAALDKQLANQSKVFKRKLAVERQEFAQKLADSQQELSSLSDLAIPVPTPSEGATEPNTQDVVVDPPYAEIIKSLEHEIEQANQERIVVSMRARLSDIQSQIQSSLDGATNAPANEDTPSEAPSHLSRHSNAMGGGSYAGTHVPTQSTYASTPSSTSTLPLPLAVSPQPLDNHPTVLPPIPILDQRLTLADLSMSQPPASTPQSYPLNSGGAATTVLAFQARNNAPIITNWNAKEIDLFERFCFDNRLPRIDREEAWLFLRQTFPTDTLDLLSGLMDVYSEEHRIPRKLIHQMDIEEVIRILRGIVIQHDTSAAYNITNTLEGNLGVLTGKYIPDNRDDAHIMRLAINKVFKHCPSNITENISDVIASVTRWMKTLKLCPRIHMKR